MKKSNKFTKGVFFIVALMVTGFLWSSYGWRLMDIDACSGPDMIVISDVSIKANNVNISGDVDSSASKYVGFKHELVGDELHIGLKYRLIVLSSGTSSFNLSIPIDESNYQKIVLRGQGESKVIWTK